MHTETLSFLGGLGGWQWHPEEERSNRKGATEAYSSYITICCLVHFMSCIVLSTVMLRHHRGDPKQATLSRDSLELLVCHTVFPIGSRPVSPPPLLPECSFVRVES